jgi:hypothetical protein
MRATRIISVGIAVILVALTCWAPPHGQDDSIDPNKLMENLQDQPYDPSNYDPTKVIHESKELAMLKAGDPGAVNDNPGGLGLAIMSIPALAGLPGLIAGLSIPATATTAAGAGTGLVVASGTDALGNAVANNLATPDPSSLIADANVSGGGEADGGGGD